MMVRTILLSSVLGFSMGTAMAAVDTHAPAPAAKSRAAIAAEAVAKQKAAADAKAKQAAAPAAKAPPQLPQLTAAQIVDKNVAARGGLEAWKRVQSVAMSGKLDVGRVRKENPTALMSRRDVRIMSQKEAAQAKAGSDSGELVQLPFVMEMQRPRKMRFELQFRGDTAVQVYDGQHGWKLRPFLNRHQVEPYTKEELKTASEQQDLDGPLINYAAKGTKVALDGTDWVDDRPAYKLKLTLKTGDVHHVWVDGQTFLDVKMDGSPRRLDGKMHAVYVYERDFKAVDGLMFPYLTETAVDGVKDTEKIHFEKITVNPQLDPSHFAKPK